MARQYWAEKAAGHARAGRDGMEWSDGSGWRLKNASALTARLIGMFCHLGCRAIFGVRYEGGLHWVGGFRLLLVM